MSVRQTLCALIAATAIAPSAGFAQSNINRLQNSSPDSPGISPIANKHQKIIVAIGASTGIGLSYLPIMIMTEHKLLEKHAAALGLNATLQFQHFPKAAPMYDALLSGKLDFAAGGITQLLTSWDKTRTDYKIKGVGALNSMPLYLVTSNARVKSLADFTPEDKIALVAVRTSIEAVVLSMDEEKTFGPGQAKRIDTLTVPLGHPESVAALLGGKSDVDAHVASAPFMYEELASPRLHTVFDSYDVLGGPHTHNLVWATTKFHDANPKIVEAFVSALQEAFDEIKADPAAAAALYLKTDKIKDMSIEHIEEIIRKPENEWTMTPKKIMAFATFMKKTGLISTTPTNWNEIFFDDIKSLPGS